MYLPEVNRFYIYPVIQLNTTMFFKLSAMQQTDWCVALIAEQDAQNGNEYYLSDKSRG